MSIVVLVSLLSGLAGIAGFVLRFVDIDKLSERYKMPQAAFIALALSPLVIATGLFVLISVLDSDSSEGDTVTPGFGQGTPTPPAVFRFNAFSTVFDEATGDQQNPVQPGGTVSVCPDGEVYASVHYDRLPTGTRLTGMWVRGAVVLQQDVARNDDLTGSLWWRMKPVDMTANHFQLWREDQMLGEWGFSLFCGSPTPTPRPTSVPVAPTFPSAGTPTPTPLRATFEILGFATGDGSGDVPSPTIPVNDTIPCDLDVLYIWVRHEGLAEGVTLEGKWTFDGGHISVGDGSFTNENETDDLWFKLDLGLWENGAYVFTESIDGASVASAGLQIAGC